MMDWSIIIATFLGPIIAVLITLYSQRREQDYWRKVAVFQDLIKSRRRPLSQDHVDAINLVPIEFTNKVKVMTKFNELMTLLESSDWNSSDEATKRSIIDRTDVKRAEMLSEIAKTVRIRLPDMDIYRGGYHPAGWSNMEKQQHDIQDAFKKVLEGNRAIRIINESQSQEDLRQAPFGLPPSRE